MEERGAMLDNVASGRGKGKREVSDERVWISGDRADVTSLIPFWNNNGDFVRRFWDSKVLSRKKGRRLTLYGLTGDQGLVRTRRADPGGSPF